MEDDATIHETNVIELCEWQMKNLDFSREKGILEQLSKATFFYEVRKSRAFLRCYATGKKRNQYSNFVKNHGFESFSNISFPLNDMPPKNKNNKVSST